MASVKFFAGAKDAKAADPLQDFPTSEMWRVLTDGWQHMYGPEGYNEYYYNGMYKAFNDFVLKQTDDMTPDTLLKMYLTACESEQNFKQNMEENKDGFRSEEKLGIFAVGYDKNKNEEGLSINGLDEFIDELMLAYYKRWMICFIEAKETDDEEYRDQAINERIDKREFFDPKSFNNDKVEMKKQLQAKLLDPKVDIVMVCLSFPVSRHKKILSEILNKFNQSIAEAKDDVDKKISAIVKLIQRLNLYHVFPDGNGRVYAFLLQNMLLRKHLQCMAFTFTPAHFSGHSTEELVAEVKQGIAEFEKYKVTKAREFLEKNPLTGDEKQYAEKFAANLADDKLIAMAQINELYKRVKNDAMPIKQNPDGVLKMLKKLYIQQLDELMPQQVKIAGPVTLSEILNCHEAIVQDLGQQEVDDIQKKLLLIFAEPAATQEQKKTPGSNITNTPGS